MIDYLATAHMVKIAGPDAELNPAMHWLIINVGMIGVFYAKVLGFLILALLILRLRGDNLRFLSRALCISVVPYAINALWTIWVTIDS